MIIEMKKKEGLALCEKEVKNADDDVIDTRKYHNSESSILPYDYLNNTSIHNDERLHTLLYS